MASRIPLRGGRVGSDSSTASAQPPWFPVLSWKRLSAASVKRPGLLHCSLLRSPPRPSLSSPVWSERGAWQRGLEMTLEDESLLPSLLTAARGR